MDRIESVARWSRERRRTYEADSSQLFFLLGMCWGVSARVSIWGLGCTQGGTGGLVPRRPASRHERIPWTGCCLLLSILLAAYLQQYFVCPKYEVVLP